MVQRTLVGNREEEFSLLETQPAQTTDPHALACVKVWGGNRRTEGEVELPGLRGWVYSRPFEQSLQGGDVHYLSVCDQGLISRVALADVSGHGCGVSSVAKLLLQLIRRHINTWDQSDLMSALDQTLGEGTRDSQYATAVVLGYFRELGQLVFTLAGHPRPLWFHADDERWDFLEHDTALAALPLAQLPLGLISGTSYQQTVVDFAPGDLVILYTDAVFESENEGGEQLGLERLFELAKTLPVDSPAAAGRALLSALEIFRNGQPSQDDETVIVLQRPQAGRSTHLN